MPFGVKYDAKILNDKKFITIETKWDLYNERLNVMRSKLEKLQIYALKVVHFVMLYEIDIDHKFMKKKRFIIQKWIYAVQKWIKICQYV